MRQFLFVFARVTYYWAVTLKSRVECGLQLHATNDPATLACRTADLQSRERSRTVRVCPAREVEF